MPASSAAARTPSALPPSRLLRSQAARRARVLQAVLALAHEGGYEAVQLRAVADRSGVGLDTIYRYFGSRDKLISAAVAMWLQKEYFDPAPTWPQGDTAVERLLSLYHGSWQVWENNPNMLNTFVQAALAESSPETGLAAQSMNVIVPISEAILEDVDPAYRSDVLDIMSHIYHSGMTHVLRGQLQFHDIYAILERSLRRLAQHPAMAGQRPKAWDYAGPAVPEPHPAAARTRSPRRRERAEA